MPALRLIHSSARERLDALIPRLYAALVDNDPSATSHLLFQAIRAECPPSLTVVPTVRSGKTHA